MRAQFKSRSLTPERLDLGDYTPAEYAKWQREMRLIHGFFGEIKALKGSLLAEIERLKLSDVSILDVGAARGYLLSCIDERLNGTRRTLLAADIESDGLRSSIGKAVPVQCSGQRLPFADDSVDYAYSTLTLHHLSDEEAVKFLREMARVTRRRIFVIDLNRDRTAYYLYRLFSPLFFQKLTSEDGALSILRSRTPDELNRLAERAGLVDVAVKHSRVNRLVLSGRL